jgi:hypothetical protein
MRGAYGSDWGDDRNGAIRYEVRRGGPAQFPAGQLHASSFAGATADAFFEFVQRQGRGWITVMCFETGLDDRFLFGTKRPVLEFQCAANENLTLLNGECRQFFQYLCEAHDEFTR